jgi:hypothetical protein
MLLVVCKIRPSVCAAYRSHAGETAASLTSFYDKLNSLDLPVSEALVRETALHMCHIVAGFSCPRNEMITGYRSRIVDGSKIAATDRRLKVLREQDGSPLPGFGLVVYEPKCQLITETILCEEGHAQERSLFPRLLGLVQSNDLWIADRNFCCWSYLSGIAQKNGSFLIRQHASTRWIPTSELVPVGDIETGAVFEQQGYLESPATANGCRFVVLKFNSKHPHEIVIRFWDYFPIFPKQFRQQNWRRRIENVGGLRRRFRSWKSCWRVKFKHWLILRRRYLR